MGKQIGVILMLLLIVSVQAQEPTITYKQVDSTTYAYYLEKNWKPLIALGKKSQNEGVDFYYLKVRMGIAYFEEGKMLRAVKMLEEANNINAYDVVVQEYLYWAYRYSGLILESHLFYTKLSKPVADKINLDLPFVSAINLGVLTTSNIDNDAMLQGNDNTSNDGELRIFSENYQLFSVGLNHPLSKKTNFYHQLSLLPSSLIMQENVGGSLENTKYDASESRYYADITFALENRWYLDTYLNVIFGKVDNIDAETVINYMPSGRTFISSSAATINYTDYVFGAAITKASYYIKSTVNASVSNLNGFQQFQSGYTMSLYPLGNTFLVPFGSVQYQSQEGTTNLVYTGGVSLNAANFSATGYANTGEMYNFVANNGALIYNQSASTLNELGFILQYYTDKISVKLGYSFMDMEDNYANEEGTIPEKFQFNQQNIIGGITWKF